MASVVCAPMAAGRFWRKAHFFKNIYLPPLSAGDVHCLKKTLTKWQRRGPGSAACSVQKRKREREAPLRAFEKKKDTQIRSGSAKKARTRRRRWLCDARFACKRPQRQRRWCRVDTPSFARSAFGDGSQSGAQNARSAALPPRRFAGKATAPRSHLPRHHSQPLPQLRRQTSAGSTTRSSSARRSGCGRLLPGNRGSSRQQTLRECATAETQLRRSTFSVRCCARSGRGRLTPTSFCRIFTRSNSSVSTATKAAAQLRGGTAQTMQKTRPTTTTRTNMAAALNLGGTKEGQSHSECPKRRRHNSSSDQGENGCHRANDTNRLHSRWKTQHQQPVQTNFNKKIGRRSCVHLSGGLNAQRKHAWSGALQSSCAEALPRIWRRRRLRSLQRRG